MKTEKDAGLMSQRAQEALFAALVDGRLMSGQFLSMSQLVELLGLPLAPVREAAKMAEMHELLTILPKRGVQVMDTGQEMTRACMDLRSILDQEGARRRIAKDEPIAIAPLRRAHQAALKAAQGAPSPELSQRAIRTDLSLHDYLAGGLCNPLATRAYEANRLRIAVIQNSRPFLYDRIVSAMEEHLAIIDALEARDETACIDAIRYHYQRTLTWWGIYD